ncbi:DNA mismatch repair protein MutS [Porphyromonadaceae bacterium W3.11]|nr:DNA mismatch repair protein MutS [Porphyromonadaceae bacterium W3.11]
MKDFRNTLEQFSALLFVSQDVEFCSSLGRHAMLDAPWLDSIDGINENLNKVERFYGYMTDASQEKGIEELELVLSELVNINGSIQTIKQTDSICSDVDFFEIKKLAIVEEKVRQLSSDYGFELESKPALTKVLEVLDPLAQRLPTFYLSSDFDPQLGLLRKKQEQSKSDEEQSKIAEEIAKLEDSVRARLTKQLSASADDLMSVLRAFSQDILALGKARWAIEIGAVRPIPREKGRSVIKNVIHPEVKSSLEKRGLEFQPVSIDFLSEPTLITGANMAGKSVLLSSIALLQLLMQYGWYVPAEYAELVMVDEVMLSVGDGQDLSNGLSSFGAEMLRMDAIVKMVKAGRRVLALVDEPARSTNPTEGHALVMGLVQLLKNYQVRAIITTHYSNINIDVRRWRVKGFVEDRLVQPLRINQLNQCIDYSLEEDVLETVPQEAFRIARILGVDEELLEMCKVE